jgi:hypothetical protein
VGEGHGLRAKLSRFLRAATGSTDGRLGESIGSSLRIPPWVHDVSSSAMAPPARADLSHPRRPRPRGARARVPRGLPRRLWIAGLLAPLLPVGSLSAAAEPAAAQATGGGQAQTAGPADSIADLLLSLAKDPLRNFAFDQVGIPTTSSQIKQLSEKIDRLSAQLTAVEAHLNAQIKELAVQTRLDYLQDTATDIGTLYRADYVPLVNSIVTLNEVLDKPHDKAAEDAARQDYTTHKEQFLSFANSIKVHTLAEKIHNRLQPLDGNGVLRDYSALIMVKHRELTSSDSERVYTLYTYMEESQALATWMSVERYLAIGGSSKPLVQPEIDRFTKWMKEQRDSSASNGLRTPIPKGVVIDRGPDLGDADKYTTVGKWMYAYVGRSYYWMPASQYFRDLPDQPDNVPQGVNRANAEKPGGFTGWTAPNGTQIDGLMGGLPANPDRTVIESYLTSLFPGQDLDPNGIWISDSREDTFGAVHQVVSVANAQHYSSAPPMPSRLDPDAIPKGILLYLNARNGLVVVRPVGQTQYLP